MRQTVSGRSSMTVISDAARKAASDPFRALLGADPLFKRLLYAARGLAMTDVTVLIQGEVGTGKKLLASTMNAASPRSSGPWVPARCSELGEPSALSERIDAAREGTLFLDEIGELPLPAQVRLQRFLDSKARGNVRVMAATQHDLEELMAASRFRSELFYRLRVVSLDLPPLRWRTGDVDLLLDAFDRELTKRYGKPSPRYRRAARKVLRSYGWPGNVLELRNFCQQMVLLRSGRDVGPEDLPSPMQFPGESTRTPFRSPKVGIRFAEWEAELFRQALARAAGSRSRAARLLGLSRDTFVYRLERYAES